MVVGVWTGYTTHGLQLMETLFEIAGAAGICGGNEGLWGRLVPSQRACFVASFFCIRSVENGTGQETNEAIADSVVCVAAALCMVCRI
jgi:hypothetical protein